MEAELVGEVGPVTIRRWGSGTWHGPFFESLGGLYKRGGKHAIKHNVAQ